MKGLFVLLLFFFAMSPLLKAQETLSFPVEKYVLENGLTVLLYKDATVPLVSYHTWVRVGSKDEEVGFTGIAHLFEHLMFKGTQKFSNKDYEKTLKEIGASNNAFTSRDYTGYYVNAPSEHLERIMELESDRFRGLLLTEENLKSEREVVKEERRFRVENKVEGLVFEKIYELAYQTHSYRWPVIGYMQDLDAITIEKAQSFFKTFYSPNNMVLVIAGNIDIPKTQKLIQRYYGSLKLQKVSRPVYELDPPQSKAREALIKKEMQSDYLTVSFVLPGQNSEDLYSLELLSEVLGKGESSRLYKKLVYDQQVATAVYSFVTSNFDSSLLQIHVRLKPAKNQAQADTFKNRALSQVWTELFNLRSYDIQPNELLKAKNKITKAHVDNLKTVDGRAYSLAMHETVLRDYRRLFSDLESYQRVQVQDIKRVASRYLVQKKSNVVLARPDSYR